jgi:hypothetical protein
MQSPKMTAGGDAIQRQNAKTPNRATVPCFAAGVTGQRGIGRELNRRGIPAPRGGAWSHMQAGALLRRLEAAA